VVVVVVVVAIKKIISTPWNGDFRRYNSDNGWGLVQLAKDGDKRQVLGGEEIISSMDNN